jgi:hypothetical protein
MSAGPERLFLSTMLTISDLRSRLGSDTVEALECLRSWLKITDIEIEALIGEATKQREGQDIAEEVEEKSAL